MHKIVRTSTVPLSLDLFCRGLLRELAQEYEVIALSSPLAELEAVAAREGVRTVGVPMRRPMAPLHDLVSLWRLVRVFRRERPQLVHSITPKAGLLSMLAARIAGVPVRVHTFTGLLFPTASGLRRRLLMLADRIICRCATHVLAEGEGVKTDLLRYGITRKRVEVLGYGNVRGIDLTHYDRTPEVVAEAARIRASLGIGEGAFAFVFVGRLVHDKGIDELLELFERLTSGGCDAHLLLVGDEEPTDRLDAATRRRIAALPRVHGIGWQQDVRPWYAAADALIFPSHREGFPNAVIEAGALELPSIVTDINGSREIILDGENGLIVPLGDTEALYRSMQALIADPASARAMGRRARPLVASRYEQGFVRACLKTFYHTVLP